MKIKEISLAFLLLCCIENVPNRELLLNRYTPGEQWKLFPIFSLNINNVFQLLSCDVLVSSVLIKSGRS